MKGSNDLSLFLFGIIFFDRLPGGGGEEFYVSPLDLFFDRFRHLHPADVSRSYNKEFRFRLEKRLEIFSGEGVSFFAPPGDLNAAGK